jgi:hypothetical protein
MAKGKFSLVVLIVSIALLWYFWPQIDSVFKEPTCTSLNAGFHSMLNQSNYCTQDSDCIVLDTGCQLGCYEFINKNSNINQLLELSAQFVKAGCKVCNEDCANSPKQEDVVCSGGKCVVKEQN